MPTFSQIIGNSAQIKFTYADEEITIDFYPGRVNEDILRIFHAVESIKDETGFDDIAAFNEALAKLIKSWDVTEDDGVTMYPLVAERLAELPLHFRGRVAGAMLKDFRPEA